MKESVKDFLKGINSGLFKSMSTCSCCNIKLRNIGVFKKFSGGNSGIPKIILTMHESLEEFLQESLEECLMGT